MLIKHEQINETTERHPRTMAEAFGDGAHIWAEAETHPHDRIVMGACLIAALAGAAILVIWG